MFLLNVFTLTWIICGMTNKSYIKQRYIPAITPHLENISDEFYRSGLLKAKCFSLNSPVKFDPTKILMKTWAPVPLVQIHDLVNEYLDWRFGRILDFKGHSLLGFVNIQYQATFMFEESLFSDTYFILYSPKAINIFTEIILRGGGMMKAIFFYLKRKQILEIETIYWRLFVCLAECLLGINQNTSLTNFKLRKIFLNLQFAVELLCFILSFQSHSICCPNHLFANNNLYHHMISASAHQTRE